MHTRVIETGNNTLGKVSLGTRRNIVEMIREQFHTRGWEVSQEWTQGCRQICVSQYMGIVKEPGKEDTEGP